VTGAASATMTATVDTDGGVTTIGDGGASD
jgi:hypothetical protein